MPDRPTGLDWVRIAARYRLGLMTSQDIKDTAIALARAGHWSSAIDDIYSSPNPIMSDVGPAFETILRDEGVELAEEEEARVILLREYLADIADGTVPPRLGMDRIMLEIYDPLHDERESILYVGEALGIEHLVGDYYSYDELDERPDEVSCDGHFGEAAIKALDAHIVETAKSWLQKNKA